MQDQYDNQLTTTSPTARDHYVDGLTRLLNADDGITASFQSAIDADPDLALAYCGLARYQQICGDAQSARQSADKAAALSGQVTPREAAHIAAMQLLTTGQVPKAYQLIREHLHEYPRDAMLTQTCTSVFGLIGFSGQPGREAELLAFTESLLDDYGDDPWFLCQHAFSLCETGQLDRADKLIDQSLALNPRSAHAAHIRAHVCYETGAVSDGQQFLDEWLPDYSRHAYMHCHISWHVALWALLDGNIEHFWSVVDNDVMPGAAWGPPLNVLTDAAAILQRAELAGQPAGTERWQRVSEYATEFFPRPGLAFADVHSALVHASAGRGEPLDTIITNARGPAGDVVKDLASGFRAIAAQDWATARDCLVRGMSDHARIGGSRAQRDLLEFALASVLLRLGESDSATMLLSLRRPVHNGRQPVAGLAN